MSLISQNVVPKKQREKVKGQVANGSPVDKETLLVDEHKLKSSKRKKRGRDYDLLEGKREQEKEMKKLESLLFGTLYSSMEFGKEAGGEEEEEVARDVPLFFLDKSTCDEMMVYEEDLHSRIEEEHKEERKPAWVDDEEERTEVDIVKVNRLRKLRKEVDEHVISGADYVARLRAQHAKLNPGTEWAQIDQTSAHVGDSDDESDGESGVTVDHGYEDMEGDDILRSNDELVVKGRDKLLPGLLEYLRLMNANSEEPSNGPINSVQFHRNGQLLLTAGLDRRLRFFQGEESSFDLVKAAVNKIGPLLEREEKSLEAFEVSPDSSTMAFIGNKSYILLMSSRTKELIGTIKMNGSARSLAFADGGQSLLSSGGDGQVYHWDLRTMRCIHKAVDEGCIMGSALCVSPDSSLFAAGSSSGIVNVYKREEFLGGKRKPLRSIENLTTMVDFMKFNHDAQILAISSRMKKNGLKLIHVPSFTAFSNYPPPRFSLHYPRALDFSPHGGFMAIGNADGKVLLYKLHHYQNA